MRMRYAVLVDPAVIGDEHRWAVVLNDKLLAQFETPNAAERYARSLAAQDRIAGRSAALEIEGRLVEFGNA